MNEDDDDNKENIIQNKNKQFTNSYITTHPHPHKNKRKQNVFQIIKQKAINKQQQ